jgi:hypothetical protein
MLQNPLSDRVMISALSFPGFSILLVRCDAVYFGRYVAAFQRVTPYIMWPVLFSSGHFTYPFILSFVRRAHKIEKSDSFATCIHMEQLSSHWMDFHESDI